MRLPRVPSMSNRIIGRIDVPSTSSAGYITRAVTGFGIATATTIVRIVTKIAIPAIIVMVIVVAGAITVAINRHSTVQAGAGEPQHSKKEGGQLPALPNYLGLRWIKTADSIRVARNYLSLHAGPGVSILIHFRFFSTFCL